MCLTYGEDGDDWEPVPDRPGVVRARQELLELLAEVGHSIPRDRWVIGQRVYYLGEEGRWGRALEVVGECGEEVGWWCPALRGLAYHGQDRYAESLEAFRRAFQAMDQEERREWRDPGPILDRDAYDFWEDVEEGERERVRRRLWALADPLLLVPGNDRRTAHFARRTLSWVREEAENVYGISWGWDLDELVLRYGSELGWERSRPSVMSLDPAAVVGRHHPESRQYVPPGEVLARPSEVEPGAWDLEARRPRSAYAPAYAPRMVTPPFQVARFRRGDTLVVVTGFGLAEADTLREGNRVASVGDREGETEESGTDRGREPPPGPPASDEPGLPTGPVEAALVLLDLDGSKVAETWTRGETKGGLVARVPAGSYWASVEVWNPREARAARARQGVSQTALTPEVVSISDLVVLERRTDPPAVLDEAIDRILPVPRVCPGGGVGVGWELYGVGIVREELSFRLRMRRLDRGIFRRAGEFLGIVDREEPVSLEWTETGPGRLGPFFRAVDLTLPPEAKSGEYRLRLTVELPGRTPIEAERPVSVLGEERCTG